MGEYEKAASDLRSYLALTPLAEDREEVERKLATLEASCLGGSSEAAAELSL